MNEEKEETVQEEVSEETPVTEETPAEEAPEETPAETPEENLALPEGKEEIDYSKYSSPETISSKEDMYSSIDEKQKAFDSFYKKNKRLNLIIMGVFMVAIIAVIFFLGTSSGAYIWVLLGLVVAYFVILTFFSKYTKKVLNEQANSLIRNYFTKLDSYIFADEGYSDIKFNLDDKLSQKELESLKIVKGISHVGGRDFITGQFEGTSFHGGDALIRTSEPDEKGKLQQYIVFLGRMFIYDAETSLNGGRAVIYLKGKGANGPTDIADLTPVNDVLSDKFAVYASSSLSEVITPEVQNILESFEINEQLIDSFIVIEPHRIAVGLSYSDAIMSVPLFDKFVPSSIDQYSSDMKKTASLVKALKK